MGHVTLFSFFCGQDIVEGKFDHARNTLRRIQLSSYFFFLKSQYIFLLVVEITPFLYIYASLWLARGVLPTYSLMFCNISPSLCFIPFSFHQSVIQLCCVRLKLKLWKGVINTKHIWNCIVLPGIMDILLLLVENSSLVILSIALVVAIPFILGHTGVFDSVKKERSSDSLNQSPFDRACLAVSRTKSLSNDQKLLLYGLFKQATVGKCTQPKPSALDIVAKSKW